TGLSGRDALRMRPVAFDDTSRTEFATGRGWKRREIEEIFRIQWAAAHGMATDEELDWLRGRRVNGRRVADTQEHLNEIARRGEPAAADRNEPRPDRSAQWSPDVLGAAGRRDGQLGRGARRPRSRPRRA